MSPNYNMTLPKQHELFRETVKLYNFRIPLLVCSYVPV